MSGLILLHNNTYTFTNVTLTELIRLHINVAYTLERNLKPPVLK